METAVLCGEGELVPQFRAAGIPVHLLKARNRFDPLALGRLVSLLREQPVRHRALAPVSRGHLRRAGRGSAWASSDRCWFQRATTTIDSSSTRSSAWCTTPISARQDLIIAISDHIARFTVARGVRHPSRVRRVYHGLEPPVTLALEREGQRIRAELGIGPDAFLVGNVGRLALQKGQRHLIAAMPHAARARAAGARRDRWRRRP